MFRSHAFIKERAAHLFARIECKHDPTPSEADIKVTRDLIRAGQLLKLEVLDHVIIDATGHQSLRSLGYFY